MSERVERKKTEMEEEAHAGAGDVEVKLSDDVKVAEDESGKLVRNDSEPQRKEKSKEEYEETALDGEFIKVEKESEDLKEGSHSEKPREVEETQHADSNSSITSINLLEIEDKIKSLEVQLETVTRELHHSESEKSLLKSEADVANEKLEAMNKHCQEIELDRNKMKEETLAAEQKYDLQIQSLQEENGTLQSAVADLKSDLLSSKELYVQLEAKFNMVDQNFTKTDSLLSQALSHNEELELKLRSLEETHRESSMAAETAAQRNLEFEGLIQASNAAEEGVKAQLRESEIRLISAEKLNVELQEQVTLAEKKSLHAEGKIKELNDKITELTITLREVEEEHTLSKCHFQAHEDRISQLESSLSKSNSRNSELEHELQDLTEKCAEHEGRASETHKRSLELEDLVNISHSKAEDAGNKVSEQEALLEAARTQIQELEQLLSITEGKCGDAEAESKQHLSKISELSTELEAFQTKSASLEVVLQDSNEKERVLTDMLKEITEEKKKFEELSHISSEKLSQTENIIEVLQTDLKSVQEKLENVEKDLVASGAREEEMLEKLKSAEEQLEHRGREVEHATARCLEQTSLHESLLKDSELKFQEAVANFTQKDSEVKELYEKLKSLEEKAGSHQNEAVEATEKVASMKAELEESASFLVLLEKTVEDLEKKIAETEEKAQQSFSENELLVRTNSKLKSELEENQCKINELHELLNTIQAEKEASTEQLAAHMKTIAEISNEHSRGLELQSASEARLRETEAQLHQAIEKFSKRDSEATDLSEKLLALESQLRVYEKEVSEKSAFAEGQKIELEEAQVKIKDLETFLQETQSAADKFRTESESLASMSVILSQRVATYEAKMDELEAALNAVSAEKEDTSAQLHSSRKSVEDLMQQLVSDGEKLQSQISSVMEENNMLNKMYQEAKEELRAATILMDQKVNEHKAKEISFNADLENLKAVQSEKSLLQDRILELEQKVSLAESKHKEDIESMEAVVAGKNVVLTSKLEELASIVQERDLLNKQLEELKNELYLAQSTLKDQEEVNSKKELEKEAAMKNTLGELEAVHQHATLVENQVEELKQKLQIAEFHYNEKVTEEGRKIDIANAEINDLKHKLSQSAELETKIMKLETQLQSVETKSVEQAKDVTVETHPADVVEGRSRDVAFGSSSPSKRKSKKKSEGIQQTPEVVAASQPTTATTSGPSGALDLKFVLGVLLAAVIFGFILGKKY